MNTPQKGVAAFGGLLLVVSINFGQTTTTERPSKNPVNPLIRRNLTLEEQKEINLRRREEALRRLGDGEAEPETSDDLLPPEKITELMEERKKRKKAEAMLKPPAAYRAKFNIFLKDKKTDLARLFVDKNCDNKMTVAVKDFEKCADAVPLKGGGSFYSFRHRSGLIYDANWSDIKLADSPRRLAVGNTDVQGIIAEIGEVNLEEVNLESAALKFLVDYRPKIVSAEVGKQVEFFKAGLNSNGFSYADSAPVLLNHTYVLRTIAYRSESKNPTDKRDDLIVVFKIVGQEDDGSLIILWKELSRAASPVLKA